MDRINQQDGLTAVSILLIILMIGGAVFVAFQLIPVYIEHFGVVSSLKSLEQEPGLHSKSQIEIQTMLRKRLEINDVKRVSKEDIEIKRQQNDTNIRIAYEVQVPFVSNISLLVAFDNSVTLR